MSNILVFPNNHRLSGLNNRNLFLTVLEARKSMMTILADSVFTESASLCVLQMAAFLLYPYTVEIASRISLTPACGINNHGSIP
jgi:hypothetical protein